MTTREIGNSATLQQNIFLAQISEIEILHGVTVNNFSDHQMTYTYGTLKEKAVFTSYTKFLKIETNIFKRSNCF